MEIKNAIVKSAEIFIEDHGILTAYLTLDYGGSLQSFGGYGLQANSWPKNTPNVAGIFIRRVLDVVGVERWSELKGKTIRVNADHTKVVAIGNIVKDDWFVPERDLAALEGK